MNVNPSLIDKNGILIDRPKSVKISNYEIHPSFQNENYEISVTVQSENSIRDLEDLYTIKNKTETLNFIKENQLVDVLIEAYHEIQNFFEQVIEVKLELYHDFEEEWETLFLIVKLRMNSPSEMQEMLDKEEMFIKKWLFPKEKLIKGRLKISVEPV